MMGGPQGGSGQQQGGPMGGIPNGMHPSEVPPGFLMDPMMQQAEINETDFPMFLMSRPEMVEKDDRALATKKFTAISRNVFFSVVGGIFLNVQVKRIPQLKFMEWPKILRVALRIPLFLLPFGLAFENSYSQFEQLAMLNHKYYLRFRKYQRTGDIKYLDPTGQIFKDFQKKMNSDTFEIN